MILIELEGGGDKRFRLEFHPRVTVVSGLSREQRSMLVNSLSKALSGGNSDIALQVDVGGIPQPLTAQLVAQLGFSRQPIDNVIGEADLPGAVVVGGEPLSQPQNEEPKDSTPEFDSAPLDEARAELSAAQAVADELAHQIESIDLPVRNVDEDELNLSAGLYQRAQQNVAQLKEKLELQTPASRVSPQEELERLQFVISSIEERIEQLKASLAQPAGDPVVIADLLEKAIAGANSHQQGAVDQERLKALANQWTHVTAQLEHLESQPVPPQWLVNQTKDDLEEAQARVNALSYQLSEGAEVEDVLARAQRHLHDAQIAADEIDNGVSAQLADAQKQQDALYEEICEATGKQPEKEDLPGALITEAVRLALVPHPSRDLASALTRMGIEVSPSDAIGMAEDWLAEQERTAGATADNQRQLATAMLDLREAQQRAAQLELQADTPQEEDRELEELRAELAEAIQVEQSCLQRLREAEAGVSTAPMAWDSEARARLQSEYEGALEAVEAAGRKVDYFAQLSALSGPEPPADDVQSEIAGDSDRPWWEGGGRVAPTPAPRPVAAASSQVDLSRVINKDVDMYVLSRAAGLRMVGRGESVPLIIDAAVDELSVEVISRTLEALQKIGSIVQVVYLAGSSDIPEKWAKRQDIYTAAVVRLERA